MAENPASSKQLHAPLVAVIDDDPTARRLMAFWLDRAGYRVVELPRARLEPGALEELPTVLCVDLGLGDADNLELVRRFQHQDADLPVIVVTAQREVETAVQAMRAGAYDYVTKPLDSDRLIHAVGRARERRELVLSLRRLETELLGRGATSALVGRGPAMRELSQQVERVLNSDVPVCIIGENGTGKQLVARAIHAGSPRGAHPFVAVNCGATPAAQQEAELFGYEAGSFAGVTQSQPGRFEQAHGGTMLLDDVAALSASAQAALLRALRERGVRRVGGTEERPVDVRIVCSCTHELQEAVEHGRFREDLYFRLVVYPIVVPPLRERKEDIPLLVGHFIQKLRADVVRDVHRVEPEALEALALHNWPGNVRELENVVHRSLLACRGDMITLSDLPPDIRRLALPTLPPNGDFDGARQLGASEDEILPLRELERRAIQHALRATNGSVSRAAKLLGIGRATLYRRIASFELAQDVA